MDLQKEREAFEAWFSQEFRCDEWEYNPFSRMEFNGIDAYSCSTVNTTWSAWQAAKAQTMPEKDAIIKKLSDQLYAQEMKASAARVLCETACELLDGYAHQDAMVILNDLEQAMSEPTND